MLERGLSVERELATRIVHDASGEGIVVAAKALGMKADVLQRILLFLNPAIGQSVERVFELAQLYDEITWSAAEQHGRDLAAERRAPAAAARAGALGRRAIECPHARDAGARIAACAAAKRPTRMQRTGSKPSR